MGLTVALATRVALRPERTEAPHPRRQLELSAGAARSVDRVVRVQATPEHANDGAKLADEIIAALATVTGEHVLANDD